MQGVSIPFCQNCGESCGFSDGIYQALPCSISISPKDLGAGLSVSELEAVFLDLDANDDGQIFFDEFSQWWLSFNRAKMFVLQDSIV